MVNNAILKMLQKYDCRTVNDWTIALKEIFQEITLLALYRGKFYERAAFYGGTALRIFYNLDRFSEDLDFTLIAPDDNFDLGRYNSFIKKEFLQYGFDVKIEQKNKVVNTPIKSAFLKANTKNELLSIDINQELFQNLPKNWQLKIKIEVDTNPPGLMETEVKYLLAPVPFSVKLVKLPYMFAGKIHAALFRKWKNRVKGRDWYDIVWYIANYPELNIEHLRERMIQTHHIMPNEELTLEKLKNIFEDTINKIDLENAKKDITPFIKAPSILNIWSKDFFIDIFQKIKIH